MILGGLHRRGVNLKPRLPFRAKPQAIQAGIGQFLHHRCGNTITQSAGACSKSGKAA